MLFQFFSTASSDNKVLASDILASDLFFLLREHLFLGMFIFRLLLVPEMFLAPARQSPHNGHVLLR